MISEQTAPQILTTSATTRTWRMPIRRQQLTRMGDCVACVARFFGRFARVPTLPYAALWEASVIVGLLSGGEKDYVEPNRYATQMPVLTDSWPRW